MKMTGWLMAIALAWCALPGIAYGKAQSAFHGVLQFPDGESPVVVTDGIYERHSYPYFGTVLTMLTGEWGTYGAYFNPDHGDTWVLEVYDTKSKNTDARIVLSYDAGSDCLVYQESPIFCDIYVPEGTRGYQINYLNIYFYGTCAGQHEYELHGTTPDSYDSWAFTPTRFRPDIELLQYTSTIRPTLSASASGKTMVAALVVDDLGCRVPLHDIDVTFENRFVPGSGGHANITTEAPITGHYKAIEAYGGDIPETQERSISFPKGAPQSYTVAPVIEGKTNQLGWFAANYTAGIFGGEERLKVTSRIEHLSNKDPSAEAIKEVTLTMKVTGLVEIEKDGLNHKFAFGTSCGNFSPEARWLTERNKVRALMLARMWFDYYGEKLSYNDASLKYGGVIDGKTLAQGCHKTHRNGTNLDVNNSANQLYTDCQIVNEIQVCRIETLRTLARWSDMPIEYSNGVHLQGAN